MKKFFKNISTKIIDRIAPLVPEFQEDLSRLDVLERINRGVKVPEYYLIEYGLDKNPVEVIERSYGI